MHESTCLWPDLSVSWNLPRISALVWQEPLPGCVSSLPVHLFEKLVKFFKREITNHNLIIGPCYVLGIECTWSLFYYASYPIRFYIHLFNGKNNNSLCTFRLGEDTIFCQLLHSFKATPPSLCKAKELTGKHT